MKIIEPPKHIIKFLGKTLCGDNRIPPYNKGQELVGSFVDFGVADV
jgi:hypothetical protein